MEISINTRPNRMEIASNQPPSLAVKELGIEGLTLDAM